MAEEPDGSNRTWSTLARVHGAAYPIDSVAVYERDIVALINQKKRTWSSRAVRSRHAYGAWLGFECLFDCVAVVSEAILKPNDLTQPDIRRHSLTCVHRRGVANYRYLAEYSGIESRLVELITRWSHLSRLPRSRCSACWLGFWSSAV